MADQDFISGALAGQQFQLNKFLIQEAPVKLEQEKLALKISQSDFDKRQQMADLLAGKMSQIPRGQNPLTNASNALLQMGQAAAEVGLPEQAAADFSKASVIMEQQEDAAYKQWQTVLQKTKFADQILSGVTDQKSLDQANAYIKMSTGTPSALEGKQYSPELMEALRKSVLTKRSEAQDAYDRARTEREKTLEKRDLADTKRIETQAHLNEVRAGVAEKNGGAGIVAKTRNINAVTDYLTSASGGSMDKDVARTLARTIALDAERFMDEDPNMTQPQAVAKAVDQAKKHGGLAGTPTGHTRPGMSQEKPLPLPKSPGDATQYKDQMWYQAPDGPRWYDEETGKLYKEGEGPEEDDE